MDTSMMVQNPVQTQEILLNFFKALANEQRIRLAALLIEQPSRTVAQIAEALGLKEREALENVAVLRELGVVTAKQVDSATAYSFDAKALYGLQKALLSRAGRPTPVDDVADPETRRTLQYLFEGDQLTLPANPKKFQLVIEWLVTLFEPGVRYTEQQVNAVITRHNEDYATLRRAMIDAMLMKREHGIYWRLTSETGQADAG